MQQSASQAKPQSEAKDWGLLKAFLFGGFLFLTLGVSLANEALTRFGMQENYFALFSLAFAVAVLLLIRNLFIIALVTFGVIAMNLPEATLVSYNLDQDVLLAVVCAIILVPSVYSMVFK
ncbi:MAG: hypothetical protein MI746_07535 [Pseudomonadales bacterium]|nr:hypothetical protein [Pseudomonadales bacterium]